MTEEKMQRPGLKNTRPGLQEAGINQGEMMHGKDEAENRNELKVNEMSIKDGALDITKRGMYESD